MRWFQATAKSGCKSQSTKGRRPSKARSTRRLGLERLEGRQMMSYLPAPVLGVPLSGSTGQATTPAFTWSPVNGASSYRIMVATNPGDLPTNPTANAGGPSVLINDAPAGASDRPSISLAPGRTYYWEVHARSASQYGLWSNEGNFTTAQANLPAPALGAPGNGATGVSAKPVFSWSQVSGNYGYRIIVATNPNDLPTNPNLSSSGSSTVFNATVGQNSTSFAWSGTLNAGATYYWEVHALGSTAGGAWSNKNGFSTAAAAADHIYSVNIPLGGGILSQILNVISELQNMENTIDSVLSETPGWHLTADLNSPPTFSGDVSGMIDEAANGTLKSASLGLTVSADASASIEGYCGISVLHVGLGATLDFDESLTASATYSAGRGWTFGGSARVSGTLTGSANATAALWKGELYAQGNITSSMSLNSSGTVSGNLVLSATVGADIQQYSFLQNGWVPFWNQSLPLGQKSFGYSFNAVSLFQDGVNLAYPGAGIIV